MTLLVASKIGAIRVDLNARLAAAEILALIREGQWVLDGQRRYTDPGDD